MAASADEPLERNFVRKHALAYSKPHGCSLETAALRVFGNADGAYGSNVNHLVGERRAGTTRTNSPRPIPAAQRLRLRPRRASRCSNRELLKSVLWQASISPIRTSIRVELGVTTVDHYFDTLGGISRAVQRAEGHRRRRSISATRPAARARSAPSRSRSRWKPAPGRSIRNGTRAAQARLRRRAPDRDACDQHHGLVGDDGRGRALGLSSS